MLHKDARKKHSRKRILRSIHCAMIRVVTVSNLRTFPSKLSLRQICSHAALQVLMLYPTYFVKRLIPALTYFRDWRVLEKMQRQADQGHRIEYQILIPQGNWIDLFRSGRMICFSFRCKLGRKSVPKLATGGDMQFLCWSRHTDSRRARPVYTLAIVLLSLT